MPDGSPTWLIEDPVRNRFFKIGWAACALLSNWHLADPVSIKQEAGRGLPFDIDDDDVKNLSKFLVNNQLVDVENADGTKALVAIYNRSKQSWFKWLLHNYLFIKFPLVRPDNFLEATSFLTDWIYSRTFLIMTLTSLFMGSFMVMRQVDQFIATLIDTVSFEGFARYTVAIVFAKIIHEFAHAFTAKRYGCRVPTIGVAFLVLWPVLYTDTTDAWRLTSRRKRVLIGLAGVWVELTIAAWSTLAWVLMSDGPVREMVFALATITWISSILINFSPFMRFDGYYVMSDLFDIHNLHARAFALARWRLRKFLFALDDPPPELFPGNRRRLLVIFAVLIWVYRLILFLGIAVLVYHFFIKIVGILLFIVEIGVFIVKPVFSEMTIWFQRRENIVKKIRSWFSLAILVALVSLAFIPWNNTVVAPAFLSARTNIGLYLSGPGYLEKALVRNGQRVQEGDLLYILSSPDIEAQARKLDANIAVLDFKLKSTGFFEEFRAQDQQLQADLVRVLSEKRATQEELLRLSVYAPTDGIIVDIEPDTREGQWLPSGTPMGTVRDATATRISAWVEESEIFRVKTGASCRFFADDPDWPILPCEVTGVERNALKKLEEPALATVFGGTIAVRTDNDQLFMEHGYYKVHTRILDAKFRPVVQLRGRVYIDAEKSSPLEKAWKFGLAVLIRESGF